MHPAKKRKLEKKKVEASVPVDYFKWLMHTPENVETFWKDYWGKHAYSVQRKDENYYKKMFTDFTIEDVAKIVDEQKLEWGVHLTGRKTVEGERQDTSPASGVATGKEVLDLYNTGSTIQFHQPQQYIEGLQNLVRGLEGIFGSLVGVNTYITPPNSQGLAPHSDDICAFALQTLGEKTWYLHELAENDRLPIEEQKNVAEENLPPLAKTVTLKVGDVLYFPKGCIHYARTSSKPSVHLTISTYQNWNWCGFMGPLLGRMLETATSKDVSFREPIPLNYLSYMGTSARKHSLKRKFVKEAGEMFKKLGTFLEKAADEAADDFGIEFISGRLPPKKKTAEIIELTESSSVFCCDPLQLRIVDGWQYEDNNSPGCCADTSCKDTSPGACADTSCQDTSCKDTSPEHHKQTELEHSAPEKNEEKEQEEETMVRQPLEGEMTMEEREMLMQEDIDPNETFWIFDSINNNKDTHMMITEQHENEPLQVELTLRPIMDKLIQLYPETITVEQLSDHADVEVECVFGFLEILLEKQIIKVKPSACGHKKTHGHGHGTLKSDGHGHGNSKSSGHGHGNSKSSGHGHGKSRNCC